MAHNYLPDNGIQFDSEILLNVKKVYLQYWVCSEKNKGVTMDGCSLHSHLTDHKKYINNIYSKRNGSIPIEYDRIVGNPIEVMVNQPIINIFTDGSLRLPNHCLNNLIDLEEIFII